MNPSLSLPRAKAESPADGSTEPQTAISFTVLGDAKPAGSKRAFPHKSTGKMIVVDSSGKAGREWRQDVQFAAREAMAGRDPLEEALIVSMVFYRRRPKSHFGTGKNSRILKPAAPWFPTTRPDLLKTARLIEDALTGIAYVDDSLIVDEYLSKRYTYDEAPRVRIDIRCL